VIQVEEVRLSSKSQIVIPKRIRDELGLRPGDKVRFEVLTGKRAVLQAATAPPEDVFVRAGRRIVEDVLGKAKKVDELKIKRLLRSLGVND
jgi:AbrB family looped-hinge helix DNA binding protein